MEKDERSLFSIASLQDVVLQQERSKLETPEISLVNQFFK